MTTASVHRVGAESLEVRVHPVGDYGSEYTWCCLAVPLDKTTVEIRMAMTAPDRDKRRHAERALMDIGYTHAVWHRPSGHVAGPFRMRG